MSIRQYPAQLPALENIRVGCEVGGSVAVEEVSSQTLNVPHPLPHFPYPGGKGGGGQWEGRERRIMRTCV